MKYLIYALVAAVIVILLAYMGIFGGLLPQSSTDSPAGQGTGETLTDDRPPVLIEVTPTELGARADTWRFAVTFTTHSGSLDQDPAQVAVLLDDKGRTYRPIAWKGPGPGGHHRTGDLVFKAVAPTPASVELKIKDVGGIPERSFKWDVK